MDKYWTECSKEEKRTVNRLARCHRNLNGLLKSKAITEKQYEKYKQQELDLLDYIEWYYSDEITQKRDFINWKQGYEMYEVYRNERV